MTRFHFPVGYIDFHKTKIIDFQLNRWYSLGYARREDLEEAARSIQTLDDWKDVMVGLADRALAEGRTMNAAFYYRAAEFFTLPSDPDKEKLYERFIDLFYHDVFGDDPMDRVSIPYNGALLPALRIPPATAERKGTIVIHGGFDSLMEEFYSMARYFADIGYEAILFEGPGQGAALRRHGIPLTYEWEKPMKAVLDHFGRTDVILLGISMGGYLCLRAAAFEPRISRVIASSIAFDYMQIPSAPIQLVARSLFLFPDLMNYLSKVKMSANPQESWGIYHLMFITKTTTPYDAGKVLLQFNEQNLHSERVRQDVLILTGAEDHFIPIKMHYKQVNALKNARSVTDRIFTREEQAQNHCQIGNIGLALDVMAEWIAKRS